jgi:hypothetical protein
MAREKDSWASLLGEVTGEGVYKQQRPPGRVAVIDLQEFPSSL